MRGPSRLVRVEPGRRSPDAGVPLVPPGPSIVSAAAGRTLENSAGAVQSHRLGLTATDLSAEIDHRGAMHPSIPSSRTDGAEASVDCTASARRTSDRHPAAPSSPPWTSRPPEEGDASGTTCDGILGFLVGLNIMNIIGGYLGRGVLVRRLRCQRDHISLGAVSSSGAGLGRPARIALGARPRKRQQRQRRCAGVDGSMQSLRRCRHDRRRFPGHSKEADLSVSEELGRRFWSRAMPLPRHSGVRSPVGPGTSGGRGTGSR